MTKFILEVYPDLPEGAPPRELLQFAVDSMRNTPDLMWDIIEDDGTRQEVQADLTGEFKPGPNDEQWIAWPRSEATDLPGAEKDDDEQIDWLLRAVTAAGADVNQRRYDLEDIAAIITRNPKAGYGRMPLDTDTHPDDCTICGGACEDDAFKPDPPGLARDGHPYIPEAYDDKPLLVEREGKEEGTFYVGDLDKGIRAAHRDRFVAEGTKVVNGVTLFVVYLADDEHPSIDDDGNVAEFGTSTRSREEAWRFALGALFGPIDTEYDEPALREHLERPVVSVKPEFEHLIAAVLETHAGSDTEDFNRPSAAEYLRGQVELLVQAGAVSASEEYDTSDKIQWLTSHLITEILLATEKEKRS